LRYLDLMQKTMVKEVVLVRVEGLGRRPSLKEKTISGSLEAREGGTYKIAEPL